VRSRRAVAEINVVPYIDVMLVLLVIFMATAPLLMQGVEVDLPKADSSPVSDSDAEPLIVSIDAQARLYLNLGASDDQALSMETVKQRVATVLKRNPDKAVMVWGDAAVSYGEVVVLMSELQEAGAPSVGLVTEAPARR
jgi:biopolymer transport protein TolR